MLYIKVVFLCASLLCFSNSEGLEIKDGYKDHYYYGLQVQLKLHKEPADWQIARMRCHEEGAILAAPWSNQFWSFLLEHVTRPDNLTIYAGVQEHFPEGIYKNISGKLILSRKLQDTVDLARCVIYHPNGTRKLVDCKLPYAYVCQAPVAETEISGCVGFNFKLDNRTGSCYKFHGECKTWHDAYKTCQAEGSFLAIINSATEVDIMKKMIPEYESYYGYYNYDYECQKVNNQAIAVGFYYWKEADTYMTIQGESIEQAGYAKWNDKHVPSRDISGGVMHSTGLLGEIGMSKRVPFICEKVPVLQKTKYPLWFF